MTAVAVFRTPNTIPTYFIFSATVASYENHARFTAIVVDSRKQPWPWHSLKRGYLCILCVCALIQFLFVFHLVRAVYESQYPKKLGPMERYKWMNELQSTAMYL
jgi:hypothetical protein